MKLLILLLLSLNVKSQNPYDLNPQDKIIAALQLKATAQATLISELTVKIRNVENRATALEAKTANQAIQITALQSKTIAQQSQINSIQNVVDALVSKSTAQAQTNAAYLARIVSLERDSLYQRNQIKALQVEAKIINSLQAVPPIRLTKIPGTLTYKNTLDTAKSTSDGAFTKFKFNQTTNLEKRMLIVEKRLQTLSGNINTQGMPVALPDKAKVIIYLRE